MVCSSFFMFFLRPKARQEVRLLFWNLFVVSQSIFPLWYSSTINVNVFLGGSYDLNHAYLKFSFADKFWGQAHRALYQTPTPIVLRLLLENNSTRPTIKDIVDTLGVVEL